MLFFALFCLCFLCAFVYCYVKENILERRQVFVYLQSLISDTETTVIWTQMQDTHKADKIGNDIYCSLGR